MSDIKISLRICKRCPRYDYQYLARDVHKPGLGDTERKQHMCRYDHDADGESLWGQNISRNKNFPYWCGSKLEHIIGRMTAKEQRRGKRKAD